MRALYVYYSRSGTTKKAAEMFARRTNAKSEEIKDGMDRKGISGYFKSAKEAFRKEIIPIEPMKLDPSQYEIVVIGSPIWAGTISSPVRSYLEKNKGKFKRVGFFCTMNGSENDKAAREVEMIVGKKLAVKTELNARDIKEGTISPRVECFIASMLTMPGF